MGYRRRVEFDQPDAESMQRSRRAMVWVIPLIIIQQGTSIFRSGAGIFTQVLSTVAWGAVTLTLLWWLLGMPLSWLSQRDQAVLNDEWNQAVSGSAARWGLIAVAIIGFVMMLARFQLELEPGLAIYGLVNGALIVAVGRSAWLNRSEPDEDE
jgi:hypothetical protein